MSGAAEIGGAERAGRSAAPGAGAAPVAGPGAVRQRLVLVTGPSGAGRSTAIATFEDLGFEPIDNLPISFVPRLFEGQPPGRPIALGLDVRNRDFSVAALLGLLVRLRAEPSLAVDLLFLDCRPEALAARYAATRRRHPLSPAEAPSVGIERERDLLGPIRDAADQRIDTSDLSPQELRAEIARLWGGPAADRLAVSVQSFAYRRGLPPGTDMLFDCRFLRNPYWDESLRALDGRSPEVTRFVEADPRFAPFFETLVRLTDLLLPAQLEEGTAHLGIAFGCTGGQHRSVTIAEKLGRRLADAGWRVSIRHRELERWTAPAAPPGKGEGS